MADKKKGSEASTHLKDAKAAKGSSSDKPKAATAAAKGKPAKK